MDSVGGTKLHGWAGFNGKGHDREVDSMRPWQGGMDSYFRRRLWQRGGFSEAIAWWGGFMCKEGLW